jgi:hypothetical protein
MNRNMIGAIGILIVVCAFSSAYAAQVLVINGRYSGEKYVGVKGEIENGDLKKIIIAAQDAVRDGGNTLTLLLNSAGGDVEEAIKIGRFAREAMATTYVYGNNLYNTGSNVGAALEKLAKLDSSIRFNLVPLKAGTLPEDRDLVRCFSACVIIFYGGVSRYASDNSYQRDSQNSRRILGQAIPVIGLHRPYYAQNKFASLSPTEAKNKYAKLEKEVRGYLIEMGAPQIVVDRMFKKPSNDLDFVPSSEFEAFYQKEEPFIDEWMIAKCGAFGPAAALSKSENNEYEEYRRAKKSAIDSRVIKTYDDLENFVQSGMSIQRIHWIEEKIGAYNSKNMSCRNTAIRKFQTEFLGQN